jgi:hypothetical protein
MAGPSGVRKGEEWQSYDKKRKEREAEGRNEWMGCRGRVEGRESTMHTGVSSI